MEGTIFLPFTARLEDWGASWDTPFPMFAGRPSKWMHIAVTYDTNKNEFILYRDGTVTASLVSKDPGFTGQSDRPVEFGNFDQDLALC